MTINKKYIDLFHNVSVRAALASYYFIGKKDKIAADKAAVDSMRDNLNKINMNGKIVIGEGELDQAPMLFIGENVGNGNGPEFDIAVDPLEGTNFVANNIKNKGKEFNLAEYKNTQPKNLTVCLLDRPRHKKRIEELRSLGVKLKLLSDGDVSGALLVTKKEYNVDMFLGIWGGPEGVLAACALDSYGCFFQGKFLFDNEKDKLRAKKMGINDLNKKYQLNEIISGDSIFCATGITSGDLVSGISISDNTFKSETLITHKSSEIRQIYKQDNNIEWYQFPVKTGKN